MPPLVPRRRAPKVATPGRTDKPPGVHTLTIPDWRPPSLNRSMRQSRWKRPKSTKAAADLIAVEAYRQGVPKATGRRRVSQHITLSGQQKEYDDDNAWKLLLDSLKLAGQLKDDSRAWCERGAVSYSRGDRTATVITLEDVR